MKKIIALALSALFIFSLAACGGGTEPPAESTGDPTASSNPASEDAFFFAPNGIRLTIGEHPEPSLTALGEAIHSFEVDSCAVDAKDITFHYPGFELTVTYPEQGEPYVTGIKLLDDTHATPEGLFIGSPAEDIFAKYGEMEDNNGFFRYQRGVSLLEFGVIDGEVRQILYGYDWDIE